MPTNSPRPFQLTFPLNARQVEEIDSMFQRLFSKLPLGAERGGTGLGFGAISVGDLLYGDVDALNDPILSTLAAGPVGKYLRSGGLFTAPSWSTLVLTDTIAVGDILIGSTLDNVTGLAIGGAGTILRSTGTLPAWSGFTIPNTFAQGDVLYASATNVVSGLAKDTNATRYLSNRGTSNAPLWSQIVLSDGVTGILPTPNGGTGLTGYTAGDLIFWSSGTAFSKIAIGGSGAFLRSNGSSPVWSTLTIPNTAVTGGIFHASATSVGTFLAIGTVGKVLRTSGTLPEWSTFTIPNTFVLGDIPFASATNVLGVNNAEFFWDNTNFRLGIGNATPGTMIDIRKDMIGSDSNLRVRNGDNTDAASNAVFIMSTGGASGGDPYFSMSVTGATTWAVGIDNSSSDSFKIAASGTLGSNDAAVFPTGGVGMTLTGALTVTSGTVLMRTTAALTNGAAAALGTLANAPAAGNPTKWIPIDDNGTTRYIPAW